MSLSHQSQTGLDVMGELPTILGSITRAVFKGLPLVPAFVLLFGAVGYFASTQVDKEFEARAEIIMLSKRLEDDRALITGSQRPLVLPPQTQDLISETHILGSTTLIEQTLASMSGAQLTKDTAIELRGTAAATASALEGEGQDLQDAEALAEAVYDIAQSLTVTIEPGSNIISINMIHQNPDYAIAFLDAHLASYFVYRDNLTRDNAQVEFLTKRVDDLQQELANVNDERRRMLDDSRAIDPTAEVELNWQTIRDELSRKGDLETQLRSLESDLRVQRASLQAWDASGPYDMPISGNRQSGSAERPGDANSYLLELHRALADARTRFNDTSDAVQQAQRQFRDAKASYTRSLRQEVAALNGNVEALRSELSQKNSTLANLRTKNEKLSKLQGDLAGLDTRLANIQANFTLALSSLESAQSLQITNSRLANVKILQQPSLTSLEPVSPNMWLFILSGAALGFLLCILLSLILFTRVKQVD